MIRLLYISTARSPVTPLVLADILRESRRNNIRFNVSGLLIVGGRRFLQSLEGPEAEVLATYDRIYRDPRHFAVVKLAHEPIEKRQFAHWSMGAQAGKTPGAAATIDQAVTALIAPITDPALRGYFTGFAQRQAAVDRDLSCPGRKSLSHFPLHRALSENQEGRAMSFERRSL